ncbi:lysophospholipid acyltransferase family protein [Variovorax sp. YR216]|uniref:lysophospholipid acyltransferase family protein n=1 Tax=Variovorax sp. YR216 TaxID=1882828 RepID=UPI000894CD56|nr:lysophospholipid acyltransferase family protein [Variovorax sp. YR216]SEA99684.1 1-acyl-sn-glycerol-3-phosphate acyltransferase [Variovorax sp. YR216]
MLAAKFMGWGLLSAIRLLTGAQARWWGCPPKAEQRIYFANHQSHLDLVMIWAALPQELRSITRPIAARDYWATTPFKRWITTEVFNAIYVERGGSAAVAPQAEQATQQAIEQAVKPWTVQGELPLAQAEAPPAIPGSAEALAPLQPLIEALRSGDSIIIFPEGTRGNTGEPQKFKSGLFTLAQMFPEVVLVPAWIDNVQRVMPKGEVVPVPILCSVTFGAPIRLEAGEERRPFLDRAREAVIALRDV